MESPWVADVGIRRILPSTVEVFVVLSAGRWGCAGLARCCILVDRSGTLIDEFGPQYADAKFDLPIITAGRCECPRPASRRLTRRASISPPG